ncbi:hypothetical protein PIB30_094420 [Stylosanthes scabra]|uniref:Uncharacterized protein n=1 Tax=Stylosanthes scabra TaxID=79078 RepID=A0ABU6YTN3_9FABA|nr:hypothetical protein [Stylosanthes scabra]
MTQLSTINKKLEKLEASAVGTQVICGICGGPHENHNCISVQDDQFSAAQVNYVGNQPRSSYNDPHSNTYNPAYLEDALTKLTINTNSFMMKQEQISEIRKLQSEIWKFKLVRLLNNSMRDLQTHFQVTLSPIQRKNARQFEL